MNSDTSDKYYTKRMENMCGAVVGFCHPHPSQPRVDSASSGVVSVMALLLYKSSFICQQSPVPYKH